MYIMCLIIIIIIFILNVSYLVRKIKQINDKLWLVKHKI